jgi:magnesium-transporting ATPase (P-type)
MFNIIVSFIPLIIFSVIDEDFDPNYKAQSSLDYKRKVKMAYLLPDMYKQTRDSKPFNVIKYIIITILSFLLAIIVFFIFKASFNGMIKNRHGDVVSYYELIFFIYFAVIIIHYFMVFIDTSFFNYLVLIFFIIQIIINVIVFIILDRIPNDNKLNGIASNLPSLNIFLVLIADCFAICIPFYILRRMELFFGMNISNLIKTNDLETIFALKFYNKKIAQMIRAIGAITKFKRIHKDMINDEHLLASKYENIIDLKMIKVVKHYEQNKKKKK